MPDTPQHYEDIHFRDITLDSAVGMIVSCRPWSQYGRFGSFGTIQPNPGQTEISDISFKDFDVTLDKDKLTTSGVSQLTFEHVIVNGKEAVAPQG